MHFPERSSYSSSFAHPICPFLRPTPTLKIRRKAETSAETIPTPLEPRFFFLRGLSADESGKRQVLSHRELDNESKFIILIFERIDTAQAETLVLRRERTDVTSEARTALRHSRGSERTHEQQISTEGKPHVRPKGLATPPWGWVEDPTRGASFGGNFKLGSWLIRSWP